MRKAAFEEALFRKTQFLGIIQKYFSQICDLRKRKIGLFLKDGLLSAFAIFGLINNSPCLLNLLHKGLYENNALTPNGIMLTHQKTWAYPGS